MPCRCLIPAGMHDRGRNGVPRGPRLAVTGVVTSAPAALGDGLGVTIDDGSGPLRLVIGPDALGGGDDRHRRHGDRDRPARPARQQRHRLCRVPAPCDASPASSTPAPRRHRRPSRRPDADANADANADRTPARRHRRRPRTPRRPRRRARTHSRAHADPPRRRSHRRRALDLHLGRPRRPIGAIVAYGVVTAEAGRLGDADPRRHPGCERRDRRAAAGWRFGVRDAAHWSRSLARLPIRTVSSRSGRAADGLRPRRVRVIAGPAAGAPRHSAKRSRAGSSVHGPVDGRPTKADRAATSRSHLGDDRGQVRIVADASSGLTADSVTVGAAYRRSSASRVSVRRARASSTGIECGRATRAT